THWSRACDEQLLVPDVRRSVSAFVSALETALGEGDYGITMPGSDAALLALSESRSRLERASTLGLPPAGAVAAALDKIALLEAPVEAAGFPCVVQRVEPQARLLSLAGVAADGRLLAIAASRYLRTWPVHAGAAAFSETVAAPDALVEAAHALLEQVGWQGIF